jgi:hypothetical protein
MNESQNIYYYFLNHYKRNFDKQKKSISKGLSKKGPILTLQMSIIALLSIL